MIFALLPPHEQETMKPSLEIAPSSQIELRIKGGNLIPVQQPWACLRFLGEDEMVDLLQHRLGKSEAEVRQVLESYHRPTSLA